MGSVTATLDARQAAALRATSLLLHPPLGVGGSRPGRKPAGSGQPSGVDYPDTVAGIVGWFGAMQAQDLGSGLWSFGVRMPGSTIADVNAALERREAVRTWPMRGTVHFVPSRDAHWMVDILGARPLANAAKRRANLGLDEHTADRATEVLATALAGGQRLTRSQCLAALAEAGIELGGQRRYHLLWYASQRGVTCIAPDVDGEQTFALLDEWVPERNRPDRDEALARMAMRYFRSHGPATSRDFIGWTGLTAGDARRGIAHVMDRLVTVRVEGQDMLADRSVFDAWGGAYPRTAAAAGFRSGSGDLLALPGFDEYLLGFKDRSLALDPGYLSAVIPGGNGVFRATLVRDHRVVATWTKTLTRTRLTVAVHPLVNSWGPSERAAAETALTAYARFHGLPLVIR